MGVWGILRLRLMPFLAVTRRDHQRLGLRECHAAWLLGVTVREYRLLEAGDADALLAGRAFERMVEVF
jgi:hypothetical protein